MAGHIVPIMSTSESTVPMPTPSTDEVASKVHTVSAERGLPPRTSVTETSVRITVPLDAAPRVYTERKLLRRDSMERRDALLKGKEGSRQRRRWENGTYMPCPR
jgi:hypothetical protein